jgi:hypothetical protein
MELIDNKDTIFNKKIESNSYILINEINDFELIDKLILNVKEGLKTSTVSGKTNVKGEHTDFTYLSTNPNFHKFLKLIQPSIYKIYEKNFIVRDVWGNIYSKEEHYAQRHSHKEASAFCGILYCTDGPGPGTFFDQYDLLIPEKKGKFVLFDPILYHEVRPYSYKKDRITIAFNFMETKPFADYNNAYFIKKNTGIIL